MLVCIIISCDASSNISTINISTFNISTSDISTSNMSTSHISSSNISASWSIQFLGPKMPAQCSGGIRGRGPLGDKVFWLGEMGPQPLHLGDNGANNVQVFVMLLGNPTLLKPTICDAHAAPTHALNQQTLPDITQGLAWELYLKENNFIISAILTWITTTKQSCSSEMCHNLPLTPDAV